jgi:tetratricopeptide (TPR) repeat protein
MFKNISYIFILLFGLSTANAQNSADFERLVNQLASNKNTSFAEIDKALNEYKSDSLKMKFLATKSQFLMGQAIALNSLGIIDRNRANYNSALEYHKKALEISEKIISKELIVISLNMTGVAYRRLDEVRLALDFHKQALSIAEKIDPKSESILRSTAVSLNSIGNIYLVLKQYDLAEKEFNVSLEIEKKLDNKLGLAINYHNLGIIYESKNDLEKALKSYKSSLGYNLQIKSKLGEIICKNGIGQIYIKQKRPAEGLNLIKETIKLAEEIGDDYYLAMAKINTGWALGKLKNYNEGEKNLFEGLEIATTKKFKSSSYDAYTHLAELYETQGKYQQALMFLKKKQEFNEQIINEENLRYTADLIVKYDNERKATQISLLEKENELVKIRLAENQRILLFGAILASLLIGIALVGYKQYQFKNDQKVLRIEQKMMRSQMNPHFLFNSLNSIKLYIINNDKEKAVYYLNKFSKLIRAILSNSQEKEISLQEELDTMELYVNIENIRFSEKINYEVLIEDGITPSSINIPSLILQPFLENAIWHGLSNRGVNKQLKIVIKKQNPNAINIDIIDNGIGRKQAQEIKDTKVSKQKSIGIELTKERLENFARNLNKSVSLEFEDLYDANNQALGTKVKIVIPLK